MNEPLDGGETLRIRVGAFVSAQSLVEPLVEQHGLKAQNSGPVFVMNPVSEIEQHVDQILHVANWLMNGAN